ncbi:MAG: alpha/beta fold hydrolase [Weeksellaceae bacterium]|nr:alpha/beta fold hydrolase [Weeksellaceae bacterium]
MKLQYIIKGNGAPVLFLHGFLENRLMWDALTDNLKEHYACILPDLPGHGNTGNVAEKHTMPLMAEKVFAMLNELSIDKVAVIGHSMGGYVALEMLRTQPDRIDKLCMFFSHPLADSEEKKQQRLEAVQTATENPKRFVELGVRGLFAESRDDEREEEIKLATEWALQNPNDGIAPALLGMREREDLTDVLKGADIPIHFILGEYDTAVDLDKTLNAIPDKPNFRINILPVGHMGHLEAEEESLELIEDFLKS